MRFVTSRGRDQLVGRPLQTVANALEGAPGVTVEQTTTAAASPILHGLTGYQTLLLLDGIRFNTSIFRSGPNQYVALIDPERVGTYRGDAGPSDGQLWERFDGRYHQRAHSGAGFRLGRRPAGVAWRVQPAGCSRADFSGETSGRATMTTPRFALTGGASVSRHNDVRAGCGDDSHNVYRRYFGLDRGQLQNVFGDRLQNTGFLQYSADARAAIRLTADQNLSLRFLRSDLQNVRSYRDQYGGANKMQSAFDPQNLNFAWGRYEKAHLGPIDTLSGTFSFNQQNDGSIVKESAGDRRSHDRRQPGGRLRLFAARDHAPGIARSGDVRRRTLRRTDLFPRVSFSTLRRERTQDRALYPNNSRYRTGGVFVRNRPPTCFAVTCAPRSGCAIPALDTRRSRRTISLPEERVWE